MINGREVRFLCYSLPTALRVVPRTNKVRVISSVIQKEQD